METSEKTAAATDVGCENSSTSTTVDGVWQTTQLDTMIGDLQRGGATGQQTAVDGTTDKVLAKDEPLAVNGDVRRTSLKKKKKRSPKPPRIIPMIRVFVGTFVHSTQSEPLMILEKWMIGVDCGKIVFSESVEHYKDVIDKFKLKEFEKECIVKIDEGSFMMPGFVDCHTHVISYLLAGLRVKHPVLSTTFVKRIDTERSSSRSLNDLVSNDKAATNLFTSYITLSIMNGITCAAYNGSFIESAARLLVDTIVRFKQRAIIGLEIFHGDNRDDTHMFQIIKARDVAEHVTRKKCDRVKPCLILSKPLPDWLEKRLADMADEMDLPIKLTVGDDRYEDVKDSLKGWVELDNTGLLRYHKKHGLVNSKSVLVNCSLCSNRDLKMIAGIGCSVVNCPSADILNCRFNTLPALLHHQLIVGLGSDLNTSHSVSMLDAIRAAVQCLNIGKCWPRPVVPVKSNVKAELDVISDKSENEYDLHRESRDSNKSSTADDDTDDDEEEQSDLRTVDVSFKELFRMATLGGATVLGLDEKIGNFEVGKEFDALYVQPNMARSKFIVVSSHDIIEEIVEKFIFLGDDRNITHVYIAGERIV